MQLNLHVLAAHIHIFPLLLQSASTTPTAGYFQLRDTFTFEPPATVPCDASQVVPRTFIGFGVEAASFPNYTNEFSLNLLQGFSQKSGTPMILRVAGTSL
jgi:hypothetical protein